jgi:creatinine amidohydrolase
MDRWTERGAALAGGAPLLWETLSWTRIRDLREAGQDLVILPVGATEQHGPHLPVGTDSAIASAVAAFASAATGVPMLPAIRYAVSVGHTEHWPGTLTLMHETLALSLREIASWLIVHGWRRILILNSHFGNDATLRVAVDRLRFDYGPLLQINTVNSWALTPAIREYFLRDGEDIHANRAETDLMLYLDPEHVDMSVCVDDEDRTEGLVFSYVVPRTSTNGVTGRPSEGSAAEGRRLLTEMGEAFAAIVERGKTEQPPLAWRRSATATAYTTGNAVAANQTLA